jgi:hypothetical protein
MWDEFCDVYSPNAEKESSKDKQTRLKCYVGIGVNNWSCYKDCAFWDGEKCSNYER